MNVLVVVDIQPLFGKPPDSVLSSIKREIRMADKVALVQAIGAGETLPEIIAALPADYIGIWKHGFSGGHLVRHAFSKLERARVCGMYSTQCVLCTAGDLAANSVHTTIVGDAIWNGGPYAIAKYRQWVETYAKRNFLELTVE